MGKPDFVFPKNKIAVKIAVFIDGCFWNGCPEHCHMPSSNRDYWEKKITGNVERDKKTDFLDITSSDTTKHRHQTVIVGLRQADSMERQPRFLHKILCRRGANHSNRW